MTGKAAALLLAGITLAGQSLDQARAESDYDGRWSGFIATELRLFSDGPLDKRQHDDNLSLAFQPEYSAGWNRRRDSLRFVPFLRWDGGDSERTHADIRELSWVHAARDWELRTGIRKVFWGVTESRHLVDVINQTDLVEGLDGEEKLGQPMINLAWIQDWGTLDLFVLPGFRERRFPGTQGRFRPPLPVDESQTRYASSAEHKHVDWAVRYSHYIDAWEFGISHFSGTVRDPRLLPGINASGSPVLTPFYETVDQTGADIQAIFGDWLWKLEMIHRNGQLEPFTSAVGGFEYTLVGFNDSDTDLGLIAEYLFDDRHQNAPQPFNNDLMLGTRWAFNDAQSTELLAGVIQDLDGRGRSFSLEASRRIGSNWKLSLEARAFNGTEPTDPLAALREDDYIQAELAWYF
ncbi:MAG: hypothetical protein ACPG4N_00470 [Gammaproteobacteria bacterium]